MIPNHCLQFSIVFPLKGFDCSPSGCEAMITQQKEARRLLKIIERSLKENRVLTYGTAAQELGRDPRTNRRMVAQVCDLLDAAAMLARVPLLALVKVREQSGYVNRSAWAEDEDLRENIIARSEAYQFGRRDFDAIAHALDELNGWGGNHAAWAYVRKTVPAPERRRIVAGIDGKVDGDAIDDIGSDAPAGAQASGMRYARDPKVRAAVLRRARGRCEYCGTPGFVCANGTRYVECHHIIALANDGTDRLTNVIALCATHHREAHFGKRRDALEQEMIGALRGKSK